MAVKKRIDLEEIAGIGLEIEIEGVTWTLSPLRLRDMAAAKAHIRGHRRASYEEYIQSFSEDKRPDYVAQAAERDEIRRQFISDLEVGQWWISELEGMLWMIHRSLSKKLPEGRESPLSSDEVEEWFANKEKAELWATGITEEIAKISGFEVTMQTEEEAKKDEAGESSSPGNSTSPASSEPIN